MLLEVLRSFEWNRIAILSSSENVWQLTAHSLRMFLENETVDIPYFETFDPGQTSSQEKDETVHKTLVAEACQVARSEYL